MSNPTEDVSPSSSNGAHRNSSCFRNPQDLHPLPFPTSSRPNIVPSSPNDGQGLSEDGTRLPLLYDSFPTPTKPAAFDVAAETKTNPSMLRTTEDVSPSSSNGAHRDSSCFRNPQDLHPLPSPNPSRPNILPSPSNGQGRSEDGTGHHPDSNPKPISRRGTNTFYVNRKPSSDAPYSLRRVLQWYHIFMISIGAVIGMGYYVRTGTIHRIGGSSAVIYAYSFLGLLSFMVMHTLATMLRVWPVRNALMSYVEAFVDKEVGMMVGILYCYAVLTTAIGQLVISWGCPVIAQVFITMIAVGLPIVFNLMDIRYFKQCELIFGGMKLGAAILITFMMNCTNYKVIDKKFDYCSSPFNETHIDRLFESSGPGRWFGNFSASVFLASFSFVGIEAVAATALEANFLSRDTERPSDDVDSQTAEAVNGQGEQPGAGAAMGQVGINDKDIKDPFRLPSITVPLVSTIIYVWGGWVVTQDIAWCDTRLPSLAWKNPNNHTNAGDSTNQSDSLFVISAMAHSSGLGTAVAILLAVNLASTSSTALFIASRSLFGLALRLSHVHEASTNLSSREKFFKLFTRKSKFDVPYAAVFGSSVWILWVPYLQYKSPALASIPCDIAMEMGSVCCILVWACESFAAYRLYVSYNKYPEARDGSIDKHLPTAADPLLYRCYWGPALFSTIFCVAIILVGGTFTFLHDKNPVHAASAYLIPILFVSGTAFGKWKHKMNGKMPGLAKLGSQEDLQDAFQTLNIQRDRDFAIIAPAQVRWFNFLGIVDWPWLESKFGGGTAGSGRTE